MFEITAEDIARLDDEKLRDVVARLCEAELRRRGLSPSCVTWGGNQSAADGGIDVRVALPTRCRKSQTPAGGRAGGGIASVVRSRAMEQISRTSVRHHYH
jgi:hypothetical protein